MKNYDVEVNGVRTTLQLSDADAKIRGLLGESTEEKAAARAEAAEKRRVAAAAKAAAEAKAKAAQAPANKEGKQPSDKQAAAAAGAFGGNKAADDSGDGTGAADDGTGASEGTQA